MSGLGVIKKNNPFLAEDNLEGLKQQESGTVSRLEEG
jgi:hypothetical protein